MIGTQQRPALASGQASVRARRHYRLEDKVRIVQETFATNASVSVIARKHDVNANIVFAWRRQYKRGQLGAPVGTAVAPPLLPIIVRSDAEPMQFEPPVESAVAAFAGHLQIHLSEQRWIHVTGSVDVEMLRAVIDELTRP